MPWTSQQLRQQQGSCTFKRKAEQKAMFLSTGGCSWQRRYACGAHPSTEVEGTQSRPEMVEARKQENGAVVEQVARVAFPQHTGNGVPQSIRPSASQLNCLEELCRHPP